MGRTKAMVGALASLIVTMCSTGCAVGGDNTDQCYWAGTLTNIHGDAMKRTYQSEWRGGQASIDKWRGFARIRSDGRFAFFIPLAREASAILLVCENRPGRWRTSATQTGDAAQTFLLRWREMPDWWHQGNFVDSTSRFPEPMNRLLDAPLSELRQMSGAYVMRGSAECRFVSDIDFDVSAQLKTEEPVPIDRQFISPRRNPDIPQTLTAEQREREAKLAALERAYIPAVAEADIRFERRRGIVNIAGSPLSDHAMTIDRELAEKRMEKREMEKGDILPY